MNVPLHCVFSMILMLIFPVKTLQIQTEGELLRRPSLRFGLQDFSASNVQPHHRGKKREKRKEIETLFNSSFTEDSSSIMDKKQKQSGMTHNIGPMSYGIVHYNSESKEFSFAEISEISQDVINQADAACWAAFENGLPSNGWDKITVQTSSNHDDETQAFCAGYIEGYLTHSTIANFWENGLPRGYSNTEWNKINTFMEEHDKFLREKVSKENTDYWSNVALILKQFDGLVKGYNDANSNTNGPKLDKLAFWLMNNDGDILDITRALSNEKVSLLSEESLLSLVTTKGRCSALIRYSEDKNDLFAAHTTWSDFSEMFRMFKYYRFNFKHESIKLKKTSFSSYPGMISSTDDWYELSTGLLVIETTINVLNEELYASVHPKNGVMSWIRTLVANNMARTGKEWTDLYSLENSGTYNDQWMIVDYNRFATKNQSSSTLPQGTLWILEQIPGTIISKDQTEILNKDKYWASYNRPFYSKINEDAMYTHYTKTKGEMFSYKHCPRARIFQAEQSKVNSIDAMKNLMQLNDYKTSKFSKGCPGNAIASRFDLPPLPGSNCGLRRYANGATDSKVLNYELFKKLQCVSIAGPTHQGDIPVFTWTQFGFQQPAGQPDRWNTEWQTIDALF